MRNPKRDWRRRVAAFLLLAALFAAGLAVSSGAASSIVSTVLSSSSGSTDTGTTATGTGSTSSDSVSTGSSSTGSTSTATSTASTSTGGAAPSGPPTISSDKGDYAPGSTVTLTGSNWDTGGTKVHIFVNDSVGSTWSYPADVTPASDGTIANSFQLPNTFIANYSVTATQQTTSGTLTATTSFTDGNPGASLDQCSNGSSLSSNTDCSPTDNTLGGWQNGDINGGTNGNAHYREGDSVPFRLIFTGLASSTTYHVTISWQATNTPAQHAYDYLTTYNQTVALANPCSTTNAPNDFVACSGSPTTFPIPADTFTLTNACGFTGSQLGGNFSTWGASITALSAYTLTACAPTSSNTDNGITIQFTTGSNSTQAVIAWAGHIASSLDWGEGHSAASIGGSPYHMALDSCKEFNCGAQDRALKAGAIFPEPGITTQVGSATVGLGGQATDTATLTGANGTVTGTVSFFLCGPTNGVASCDTGGTPAGADVPLSGGQASSTAVALSDAGTYCFRVEYTPDATAQYSSSVSTDTTDECVTVAKASPTQATSQSADGPIGSTTINDTETVSGAYGTAGTSDKVTFRLYGPFATNAAVCTAANLVHTEASVQLTGGTANTAGQTWTASTTGYTPTAAGYYAWQITADFTGDANNTTPTPNPTPCTGTGSEIVHITPLTPTISTTATDASGASAQVTDSATLSGGYSPTGTIVFKLYGPSTTASCTTSNLVFTSSAFTVTGNGTYGPAQFSPTAPGTYHWIASYTSGDGNNVSVAGTCGDIGETSVVNPGLAKVVKTVAGQTPTGTAAYTFQLRSGASTTSDGTTLQMVDASSSNGWTINFTTQLVPGNHYQLCEVIAPGWNTNLGPNLFVPNSMISPTLPNPDVNNMTVCTDFVAVAGQTTTFNIDNTPPPGGRALTIGFWKNWASCAASNGNGHKPTLDQTLAIATGLTTNPPGGLVVSAQTAGAGWPNFGPAYYLVLKGSTSTPNSAPDCSKAVALLGKYTSDGKKKMSSDPLFNMAAQLVGAQLNYFAGAGKNPPTSLNIQRAVLLLGKYGFNGLTYSPKLTTADTSTANCLQTQLNNYNNDLPVTTCP